MMLKRTIASGLPLVTVLQQEAFAYGWRIYQDEVGNTGSSDAILYYILGIVSVVLILAGIVNKTKKWFDEYNESKW